MFTVLLVGLNCSLVSCDHVGGRHMTIVVCENFCFVLHINQDAFLILFSVHMDRYVYILTKNILNVMLLYLIGAYNQTNNGK